MAKWKSAVITDSGKELMAKVLSGSEIEFTKIKTSDYKYSNDIDLSKITSIPNIKQEKTIGNIEIINKNTVSIYSNFNNKDLKEGYEVRVVGLYARDPESDSEILYSLTITDRPDYLPSFNGVTLSSIDYKFITAVGNAENVILDITDGSTVTQQQFQELKNEVDIIITDTGVLRSDIENLQSEIKDKLNVEHEKWIHESENGRHGVKIVDKNKLAFYDGYDWIEITVDPETIRDISNVPLRVQVSDKEPPAEDGRIYYNTKDKLFYVARNNQWYRLFVGGDEKLEQDAPITPPKVEKVTDTTVTLVDSDDLEFRYQGGNWQVSNYFAGLQRNEPYQFEQRYKGDDVYKASPPSPSVKVTTEKGTQAAPNPPEYEILSGSEDSVRVKVTSRESNTEVALVAGNITPSRWASSGTIYLCDYEKEYTVYARRRESHTHKPSPASTGTKFTTPANMPGPSNIVVGDKEEGYYGVVPASELITGNELASRMNVTQGTSQHSNTPWHKFAWKGKVLFIAQKTIRHSISWDHLNEKNVVYGNKTIEIDDVKYKVRLIRGALTDPSKYSDSDRGAKGSEWNRLVAPLSVQRKDNSWDYPEYMENDLKDWKTYLSDAELTVRGVDGRRSWCQEVGGDGSANRVNRGYNGVSYSYTSSSSDTNSSYGWRPVLEVF